METDEEKLRSLASRAGAWWDKAKITVMGLSILVAVLSTTWVLSGTQSQIAEQITQLAESVREVKVSVSGLTTKHEVSAGAIATQDSRIGRVEAWRDIMAPDIVLLKQRIMAIEQRLLDLPTLKERP